MKKLLTIAIAVCVLAGGVLVYLRYSEDRSAPEISFSSDVVYYDGISEEELMEGVIAVDGEDGDVSDSLTIERIVKDSDGAMATVIYAAKDSRNNVAKASRVVEYDVPQAETETEEETETEKETEKQTEKQTEKETEDEAGAESEKESENETETEIGEVSANAEGLEMTSLTDQTQTEAETKEETEEELSPYAPRITLTQSRVTIQQGDAFEPTDYVESITDDSDNKYELWRRIQVEGNYDTGITGIYQLVYYVVDTSGNTSNRETLLLIVEGNDDEDYSD